MNNEYFYSKLVENLSDQAILFFANTMKKQLPFLYLKPEDIRAKDLIEMLMQKDKDMREVHKVLPSASDLYELVLVEYMIEYARCVKGMRPDKYKIVAVNKIALVDGKYKGGVTFSDLKDAVMVFVSIFRQLSKYGRERKKYSVKATDFCVKKEDADLLKLFTGYSYNVPKSIFTELKKIKRVDCSLEERKIREFFVNVSMLLLIGLLQECGKFEE